MKLSKASTNADGIFEFLDLLGSLWIDKKPDVLTDIGGTA